MHRRLRVQTIAALTAALCVAPLSRAIVLDFGEVKGHFDTTLSVGGLYRLNPPSPDLYGISNTYNGVAGKQRSVNADDGDLNYGSSLVSALLKASHDLELNYKNSGLFVRGFYFTDFVNTNGQRKKAALSNEAQRIVGEGGELLDAYVYFKPTLGTMPARLAIGKQVLSWGESTFIPNGINSVNPIDVAKLRTPGSELKEALRPLNMVSASLGLTDKLTAEAFYLLDWERTRVDPPGTYFSTNDFVARGGTKVYLGFGAINDGSSLGAIMRGTDNEPGASGQWGLAFRYLAENLNNTEFAVYYMNYHSRLPVISARTPTVPVNGALAASDSAALLQANTAFMTGLVTAVGPTNVASSLSTLIGATLTGVPASALPATLQPFYATVASVTGQLAQRELLKSAATGNYLIEFPEDIHLFGASFNTNLAGVALQGELSYRNNQPFQVDDVELLFAALSPLSSRFSYNQLGSYALNTYIPGYRRHKVWTGQMTATKVARGIFGADQTTMIAEVGYVHADIPNPGTLRYDGPGTFVGGDINYMNASGSNASGVEPLYEPASAFATKFSWGYQLVGRLDYNNAFAGVNVSPLVLFSHDVSGNTPLPMGNFREGRKTVTVGADFSFQNAWALELRYVNFFGAGRYNLLGDRDYVSATLKYSF
ncbi:DUF1302 domain-containing protein [Oleiharenicola sp. Vm1]|uniref:DUF1302 domain-containing protein n=1 Tax=Oleiharenicola sp. Vm1 TaxID=3398393 RepID=UPI0039F61BE2